MPHRIIMSSRPSGVFSHNGRHVIWEDAGQRREVASGVTGDPKQVADRLLAFGDGVEVAHRSSLTERQPCSSLRDAPRPENVPPYLHPADCVLNSSVAGDPANAG